MYELPMQIKMYNRCSTFRGTVISNSPQPWARRRQNNPATSSPRGREAKGRRKCAWTTSQNGMHRGTVLRLSVPYCTYCTILKWHNHSNAAFGSPKPACETQRGMISRSNRILISTNKLTSSNRTHNDVGDTRAVLIIQPLLFSWQWRRRSDILPYYQDTIKACLKLYLKCVLKFFESLIYRFSGVE